MKIRSRQLVVSAAVLLVLVLAVFAAVNMDKRSPVGLPESDTSMTGQEGPSSGIDGYQQVTLSMNGGRYILEPSVLERGVPVRMTVDLKTVRGCMQDIVIPAFGVHKYVRLGDNVIEFTPDKSGTIAIACSMNMGRGTFEVSG